jgi:hypothetical protein
MLRMRLAKLGYQERFSQVWCAPRAHHNGSNPQTFRGQRAVHPTKIVGPCAVRSLNEHETRIITFRKATRHEADTFYRETAI